MLSRRHLVLLALSLPALSACSSWFNGRQPGDTFLVFFDEFDAKLSPDAKSIIAKAAGQAKQRGVRTLRVEARTSATGAADANMKLAEARATAVRNALQADGIAPTTIQLVPIGQAGTDKVGVDDRRVDIILQD